MQHKANSTLSVAHNFTFDATNLQYQQKVESERACGTHDVCVTQQIKSQKKWRLKCYTRICVCVCLRMWMCVEKNHV